MSRPSHMTRPSLNINHLGHIIILFFLSFITLGNASVGLAQDSPDPPLAKNGVLNLLAWDFVDGGAVELKGEWKAYKGYLLDPYDLRLKSAPDPTGLKHLPREWNARDFESTDSPYGHATYQLRVITALTNKPLAIYIEPMYSAYKLYLNDTLVASSGRPADSYNTERPGSIGAYINIPLIQTEFDLTLEVSNYRHYHGGPKGKILLDTSERMDSKRLYQRSMTMFLLGTAMIIGLYMFVTHTMRRNESSYLYFGLFSSIMGLGMFAQSGLMQGLLDENSQHLVWLCGYLVLFLAPAAYANFIRVLFPHEFHTTVIRALTVLGIVAALLSIIIGSRFYTFIRDPFYVLIIAVSMYVLWGLAMAVFQSRQGSVLTLAGGLSMILTQFHDYLLTINYMNGDKIYGYGFLAFIVFQSIIQSRRFARAFTHNEKLSSQLSLLNRDLERQVAQRTEDLTIKSTQLEATLNGMSNGLCVITRDRRLALYNDRFLEVLDYPEDLVHEGVHIAELYRYQAKRGDFGDDIDIETAVQDLLRKTPTEIQTTLERGLYDGRVIEVRANPLPDGGEVTSFQDITEARESENMIRRKTQLLSTTLASMTDGISVVDTDGRLVAWNDRYFEIFEIPPEYAHTNIDYSQIVQYFAERGDFGDGNIERLISRHMVQVTLSVSHTEERATPSGRLVEVRTNPMPTGGTVTTYQDVTELRNRELELEIARQTSEKANQAKSNFLATMSHEIRTPMNGILGMLELLGLTHLNSEQNDLVMTVRESANALLTIINDILDFSKIEAGKLELEIIDLSPLVTVEAIGDLLATNARKKGLSLMSYIDPNIPDLMMGDPVRLRQIILNLGGNAVKFTETGHVGLRVIIDSQTDEDMTLRFEITDTGVGMTPVQQSRLFQPFMQADESTTRKFGGTGLGLSICKRLAEMMGGRIGVTSEFGRGSTFWFTAKLNRSQTAPQDIDPTNEAARVPFMADVSGIKVLVFEMELSSQEAIVDYLTASNAHITIVETQPEAEKILFDAAHDEVPFDVIVIGETQTEHSKLSIAESIQRNNSYGNVKVIFLADDPNMAKEAETLGLSSCLMHPIKRSVLHREVAKAVGRLTESQTEAAQAEDQAAQEAALQTVEQARADGRLILVAEDHPTNQRLIRMQLERLGYTCELAENGAVAFEMYKADSYGLLLTDFHMPEMDGMALTIAVRDYETSQADADRIPIIALTANAIEGEAERCIAAGMDGFLSKPVNLNQLKHTLSEWLPGAKTVALQSVSHQQKSAAEASPPTSTGQVPASMGPSSHTTSSTAVKEAVPTASAPHPQTPTAASGFETPRIILELEQLEDFFGDDQQSAHDMLRSFLATNTDHIKRLGDPIEHKATDEVRELAHTIKGSGWSIGLKDLGDKAKALEKLAKNNKVDDFAQAYQDLQDAVMIAEKTVKAFGEHGFALPPEQSILSAPAHTHTHAHTPVPSEIPETTKTEALTQEAPTQDGATVLDLSQVADFFGDDSATAADMVQSFVETNSGLATDVIELITAGDIKGAREAAHSIKGSSWSMGMMEMGSMGKRLEDSLKEDDVEDATAALPYLEQAVTRVQSALEDFKAHGFAADLSSYAPLVDEYGYPVSGRTGPESETSADTDTSTDGTDANAPPANGQSTAPTLSSPEIQSDILDLQQIKEFFGDDFASAADMIASFLETNSAQADDLAQQLSAQNAPSARESAHSIKGSSWSMGLNELGNIGKRMEHALKQGDVDDALAALPLLQSALNRATEALESFRQNGYDIDLNHYDTLVDENGHAPDTLETAHKVNEDQSDHTPEAQTPAPSEFEKEEEEIAEPDTDPTDDEATSPAAQALDPDIALAFFADDRLMTIEMLQSFIKSTEQAAQLIEKAIENEDTLSVSNKCQKIEESCRAVGLFGIAAAAQNLIDANSAREIVPIRQALKGLKSALPVAKTAVQNFELTDLN